MPNTNLPSRIALVDKRTFLLVPVWLRFFQTVNMAPIVRGIFDVFNRASSFAATPFATLALTAGLYRLSWYARVHVVAGISSSVQVTVGWTDGGVAQTFTGALVNGNLTTSGDADTLLIRMDAGTTPTVAAAYASNPAGVMQYRVNAVLEEVPLPIGATV